MIMRRGLVRKNITVTTAPSVRASSLVRNEAKRAPDSEERTIWNTTVTLTVTTGHSVGAASLVYVRSGARGEALIVRRANK